jgi:hypothetical protein
MSTGIVGNILALVVLYTSSNEAKKTVFYTLLAGLAWTDLIGICLTSPIVHNSRTSSMAMNRKITQKPTIHIQQRRLSSL